jgi:hypothetical protein
MHIFRPCQTRPHSPQQMEHWLCTLQKEKKPVFIQLKTENKKVSLLSSKDLSPHFEGSTSTKTQTIWKKLPFHVAQKKGPLLPIKRHAQFEDRVNKERIHPLNILIPEMSRDTEACLQIQFKALPERTRQRLLKKAKRPWHQPERAWDQWESKGWLHLSWRRILGPLLRRAWTQLQHNQKENSEQTESLHEREDPKRAVLDKLSRPLFQVFISSSKPYKSFFHGFTLPYLGALYIRRNPKPMLLSAEELATILTLPELKAAAPFFESEVTAALQSSLEDPLSLGEEDRKRHLYIIGKTGMGKSSTLLEIFQRDLDANRACVLLDPHGDLTEAALQKVPMSKKNSVVFLDPSHANLPLALNPLECHSPDSASIQSSGLLEVFRTLSQGSWGPRLEYILRNTLLSLCLIPNTTLLDLPRLLTQHQFYQSKKPHLDDLELKRFWEEEYFSQNPRTRQEFAAPILNKVGPLLTSPLLRNMFGQPKNKLNFSQLFAEQKIVLINLSKGKLGEDLSRILGMTLLTMIKQALFERSNLPPDKRNFVSLIIDEFQNFATDSLCSMLAESRKYGLALTAANQYLTQLPLELQDAVLGNMGSFACFRTGQQDAQVLAPILGLEEEDLTQLSPFQCYMKLQHNAQALPVFRWNTQKSSSINELNSSEILNWSHERYGRTRQRVEAKLKKRYNTSN